MSISRQGAIRQSRKKTYGAVGSPGSSTSDGRPRNNDQLSRLQKDVIDVKNVLKDDVEKVIERGEKVADLNERTESLAHSTTLFRDSAKALKDQTQRHNWKIICCIVCVVVVVLGVVALVVLYALKVI